MLNNKHFGAALRDWELDRVIRRRLKIASIGMMAVGAGLLYWRYAGERPALAYSLISLFFAAAVFVATRRSRSRPEPPPKIETRFPV
jgi:uncharacterized membrane protein YbaN (DUF454 family)